MTPPRNGAHAAYLSAVPPRARPFQGQRAGIVTRMAANIVDLLVVAGIVVVIYAAIAGIGFLLNPSNFHWPDGLGAGLPAVGAVVLVPYLTLCWRITGRTYGDALFGLRVVNSKDERLRVPRALLRAFFCAVFPIGVLWVAVSSRNRSVQDVVLRTSVIYDWVPRTDASPEPGPSIV
jgi:uncharacterized RDD family membrane protein YckC